MENQFRILLTTDHSSGAMNAGRYALHLADHLGASVTLLHVYHIPLSSSSGAKNYADSTEHLHNGELKRLEQFRNDLFHSLKMSESKIAVECIVREGNAGAQIIKEAGHIKADLIIVGTHGVSTLRELFYGSHSWDVIKRSPIPVLAVPEEAVYNGLGHIAFAAEYRGGEKAAIDFLTGFAGKFDAEVNLLHVVSTMIPFGSEKKGFQKYAAEVKRRTHYKKLDMQLVRYDDVFAGLDSYCTENNPDLLVMTPERFPWFEKVFVPRPSLTRMMSFHTRVPLLTIPDYFSEPIKENNVQGKEEGTW